MGWLVSLLTGPILSALLGSIDKKIDATTERERIAVDLAKAQIEAEIAARQNVRETVVAMKGDWMPRLIALPFVIHLWAVMLDTVFRFGWAIPKFPQPFDVNGWAILMSYFGLSGARLIAGSILSRKR